jgi:lysyl endopeptidase
MKKIFQILFAMVVAITAQAQVKTIYNNTEKIGATGKFKVAYTEAAVEITAPDLKNALMRDKAEAENGSKIIYIAEPVAINFNLLKQANWVSDGEMEYGRFTLHARGAKTLSINFSDFFLPKGTELYIYSKDGEMITGPVTEKENNDLKTWGSSIYKGEEVTVEVRVPAAVKDELSLQITNLAYGYKQIFIDKTIGFGLAGACNINVLCPEGNAWVPERNSVVFIATSTGAALCSGAMVMNDCNLPYVLTANHCYDGNTNVGGWRIHFQAWSATCTPSQNSNGILFNGTTLKARWAPSDFCLVQMNTKPAANSGIHYAGWTRSTTAATSGVGIHHPRGDVMKISTYTTPLVRADNAVRCNTTAPGTLHWVVQWNQGVTEPGSSGSPLFDQNHRIVGQLAGGPSSCAQPANCRLDMYGRFDNSWTGGGTNATRLSNWLDPRNLGIVSTNTTNIANLLPLPYVPIISSIQGCSSGFQTWFLNATPTSNASNWNWSVNYLGTNSQITINTPNSPSTYVSVKGGGAVRLNYTDACGVARQDGVTVYSTCPQFRLAVSPNPANGNVVVSMNQPVADKPDAENEAPINPLRKIASKGQTVLSLFEFNTNLPMRQWKFNETKGDRYNIPLAGLRKGTYLLQVDRDNQTQVTRVMVQ